MLPEESMANRSSEFWGICCEGGKKYSQVVRQKFHMTMAALDPTVVPTSPVVSLMVDRGGCEYLLCSLKPGTLLQVNLNLYFDKGEKVTFSLIGKGKIHLSGYMIYDKNDSVPAVSDRNESKASQSNAVPANSSKTKDKQKGKHGDSSDVQEISKDHNKIGQTASPKKKLDTKDKKVKNSKDDEDSEDDEDSDDDDLFDELEDDDSSGDEESEEETENDKKDSNCLTSYKRLWSSLTQSDEEEEDTDSDEDEEDSDEKKGKEFQNKKRPKNENSGNILSKTTGKNTPGKSINVDDAKLVKNTPKQDLLNSSIGRTPMPQKKTPKESIKDSSKAATPKKVNFADIESSDSDNEKDSLSLNVSPNKAIQPSTPSSEAKKKKKKKKKKNQENPDVSSTTNESPVKPKGFSSASYSQKLPGGLEYEDIRVGNGPIAKKGRLVHVYYTGMLENNKVFDSREIGNKPFSFKLGANQVIKGWDMAVEGMKVGGKRRMKIPPSLGYANARTGPIPPNSTLYFTVELKAVS